MICKYCNQEKPMAYSSTYGCEKCNSNYYYELEQIKDNNVENDIVRPGEIAFQVIGDVNSHNGMTVIDKENIGGVLSVSCRGVKG
jgi:hypothetical protein